MHGSMLGCFVGLLTLRLGVVLSVKSLNYRRRWKLHLYVYLSVHWKWEFKSMARYSWVWFTCIAESVDVEAKHAACMLWHQTMAGPWCAGDLTGTDAPGQHCHLQCDADGGILAGEPICRDTLTGGCQHILAIKQYHFGKYHLGIKETYR